MRRLIPEWNTSVLDEQGKSRQAPPERRQPARFRTVASLAGPIDSSLSIDVHPRERLADHAGQCPVDSLRHEPPPVEQPKARPSCHRCDQRHHYH
jgi:hypothetical protein